MLLKFQKHILEHFADIASKKILLAVSGGIDSMVLADLFRKSKFDFALIHCNFKLRNTESDLDQQFVQSYSLA